MEGGVRRSQSASVTAADFRAWLERRGWNYTQAAPHLAADHTEVMRWAKGERKVPRRIARIVELLDKVEALEAAAAHDALMVPEAMRGGQ
jgi:hypothetical protein